MDDWRDEIIYCDYTEGFGQPEQCLLLLSALYGLRHSPLLWLRELTKTLNGLGLQEVIEGSCIFANDYLIVFFYVDDMAILCRTENLPHLYRFKDQLMDRYEMRDLGPLTWFLGTRIV